MKQTVHIAWHIAAASAGVLAGAALALLPQTRSFAAHIWLLAALLALLIAGFKRTKLLLLIALFGGILLGLWRGSGEQLRLAQYQPFYGQEVTVQGKVTEDTATGSAGQQQIRLGGIEIDRTPLSGQIWLSSSSRKAIKRGDIVLAKGKLNEGFGTFAAALYRAQVVDVWRPEPGDVGRRVRDWFAGKVRLAVPEPEASLGISYTLGESHGLSETVSDQFRLLGLTHLLVASGSQLTLLVRFARRPLSGSSKYLAMMGSLFLIGSFLLLTGFSPSMVRAALVSVLSLVAWYYGRTIHPIVLLSFVAGISVLIQPSFIWGDVGWLLSFAAFAGIIILAPLIAHYFWGTKQEPGFWRYLVVSTVAAQIVTLPVAVYTFGEYSPLAVVANMAILPFVSLIMLLTLASGLITALVPSAGMLVGWPLHIMLSFMTSMTEKLAALPWAHSEMKLSVSALLASYMAIVAVIVFLWRRTGHNFRRATELV